MIAFFKRFAQECDRLTTGAFRAGMKRGCEALSREKELFNKRFLQDCEVSVAVNCVCKSTVLRTFSISFLKVSKLEFDWAREDLNSSYFSAYTASCCRRVASVSSLSFTSSCDSFSFVNSYRKEYY